MSQSKVKALAGLSTAVKDSHKTLFTPSLVLFTPSLPSLLPPHYKPSWKRNMTSYPHSLWRLKTPVDTPIIFFPLPLSFPPLYAPLPQFSLLLFFPPTDHLPWYHKCIDKHPDQVHLPCGEIEAGTTDWVGNTLSIQLYEGDGAFPGSAKEISWVRKDSNQEYVQDYGSRCRWLAHSRGRDNQTH